MLFLASAALLIAVAAISMTIVQGRRLRVLQSALASLRATVSATPPATVKRTQEILVDRYSSRPCSTRVIAPSPFSPAYLEVRDARRQEEGPEPAPRPARRRVLSAARRQN